jgi:hypothetical protein
MPLQLLLTDVEAPFSADLRAVGNHVMIGQYKNVIAAETPEHAGHSRATERDLSRALDDQPHWPIIAPGAILDVSVDPGIVTLNTGMAPPWPQPARGVCNLVRQHGE